MDNFFSNNSVISITDAVINDINFDNRVTFVTVSYPDCVECRRNEQTVRLVVNRDTVIRDERGRRIPVTDLRTGMTINADISSAMTRSIPPQATAFMIQIVSRAVSDNTTTGRIINIDRQNRSFTTINENNLSSVIRFNVPENALILDSNGRRMNFSRLFPGQRVRVRHAAFMTASIPPQTTAFEVRVL